MENPSAPNPSPVSSQADEEILGVRTRYQTLLSEMRASFVGDRPGPSSRVPIVPSTSSNKRAWPRVFEYARMLLGFAKT